MAWQKGKRYKNGHLAQPTTKAERAKQRDYGNEFVQRRRALFDAPCIKGGKAADQVHDGIGQLWALDFLDGHHLDPALMRDTARKYGELYWKRNKATGVKSGKLERGDQAKDPLHDTAGDYCIERWIDDLPTYERGVLEHVVIDHWFRDGCAGFVNRLVCTELIKRGRYPLTAQLEIEGSDRAMLGALLRALFVLVDGVIPSRRMAA